MTIIRQKNKALPFQQKNPPQSLHDTIRQNYSGVSHIRCPPENALVFRPAAPFLTYRAEYRPDFRPTSSLFHPRDVVDLASYHLSRPALTKEEICRPKEITRLTLVGKTFSYLTDRMTTYYFKNQEEALKRAKAAGKTPGCYYGGITFRSGKRGWAVYRGRKVVEMYAVVSQPCL